MTVVFDILTSQKLKISFLGRKHNLSGTDD